MADKPTVAIESIMEIAPYIQGVSNIQGIDKIIKLSSNENPFGPSPKVLQAITGAALEVHRYADGGCSELRQAIAKHYDINPELIVCGAGSDELIALLCQAYAGQGDEILYNQYGFLMYPISALRVGANPVSALETNLRIDIQSLLDKISSRTKIIFIANPNNPTGSYLTRAEIIELREAMPAHILLIIDAAYAEYVTVEDYSCGMDLVENYNNIVMLRTYSKIHAMGGLRLGWCYAPQNIVDVLHRVRGPFNVSNIAMKAGIAAIEDDYYTNMCIEHNQQERSIVSQALSSLGLKIYPSVANFLLVEFPVHDVALDGHEHNEEAIIAAISDDIVIDKNASSKQLRTAQKTAAAADAFLKSKGIIGRSMLAYQLPNCMRFTIGKTEENQALIEALKEFMSH